ncbi:MAG: XRE family transcriptional regulator, partial [Ruminococcus sp.]|nr:XRE family transcriptional regulator [Ruminococcus sp.]
IACSEPIFDEITDTYISVSADIKADFCLVCKGDSMINARIHDGDVVMIQRADIVDNGRIAAVAEGDEVTLKRVYYYPEKDFLELRPENPSYESLIFTGQELEQVRIIGLAVAFTSLVR